MAVLKTTSPALSPSAPIDLPLNTEPSANTKTAGKRREENTVNVILSGCAPAAWQWPDNQGDILDLR
jgi:hypothetical protein